MAFISYAQNFEDVMLNRAFKDIIAGFYIDVGANHPHIASVTKAFYEKGWHGLNIEPIKACYEKLMIERPRDTNLCIAAGDFNGELLLHEIVGMDGLSTLDYLTASRHSLKYQKPIESYNVPVKKMDDICDELNITTVHFMKIDVERAEKQVLQGMSLKRVRPYIILVEATLPTEQISSFDEWEYLLVERGYQFIYFDGLNRFYVSAEQMHRASFFKTPPNVFDHFQNVQTLEALTKVVKLQDDIIDFKNHTEMLSQQLESLNSQLIKEQNRSIINFLYCRFKWYVKKIIIMMLKIIKKNVLLKNMIIKLLGMIYHIERRLRRLS